MANIYAYIEHREGVLDDSSMELIVAAKDLRWSGNGYCNRIWD